MGEKAWLRKAAQRSPPAKTDAVPNTADTSSVKRLTAENKVLATRVTQLELEAIGVLESKAGILTQKLLVENKLEQAEKRARKLSRALGRADEARLLLKKFTSETRTVPTKFKKGVSYPHPLNAKDRVGMIEEVRGDVYGDTKHRGFRVTCYQMDDCWVSFDQLTTAWLLNRFPKFKETLTEEGPVKDFLDTNL